MPDSRAGKVGPEMARATFVASLLAEALRGHRADMHLAGDRPCDTCKLSAKALAAYDVWNPEVPSE